MASVLVFDLFNSPAAVRQAIVIDDIASNTTTMSIACQGFFKYIIKLLVSIFSIISEIKIAYKIVEI
mgnify:CR=1 FL=1